jgi:hypothetical protein
MIEIQDRVKRLDVKITEITRISVNFRQFVPAWELKTVISINKEMLGWVSATVIKCAEEFKSAGGIRIKQQTLLSFHTKITQKKDDFMEIDYQFYLSKKREF